MSVLRADPRLHVKTEGQSPVYVSVCAGSQTNQVETCSTLSLARVSEEPSKPVVSSSSSTAADALEALADTEAAMGKTGSGPGGSDSGTSLDPAAALEKMRGTATEILQQHQADSNNPMPTTDLVQHLTKRGVWPITGVACKLSKVLKKDARLLQTVVGSAGFFSLQPVKASLNPHEHAACDAAVAVLVAHQAQQRQGKSGVARQGGGDSKSMFYGSLMSCLTKKEVWPFKGVAKPRSLWEVLKGDSRLVFTKRGLETFVSLQPGCVSGTPPTVSSLAVRIAKGMAGAAAVVPLVQQDAVQQLPAQQPAQQQLLALIQLHQQLPKLLQQQSILQEQTMKLLLKLQLSVAQQQHAQQLQVQVRQPDDSAALYQQVQLLLDYTFTDVRLLQLVLSPQGASSDDWGTVRTLAMEGDAVLDLCIIKTACHANPKLTTKALDQVKIKYVTNAVLARLAQLAGLEPSIRRLLSQRLQRTKVTVEATATVVEALFGAIHRDCCAAGKGSDAAMQHILALLDRHMAGSAGSVAKLAIMGG